MTSQKKVLVAYATRLGSTAEIAEYVGKVLREQGMAVDVRPVQQVEHVLTYHAIVLGGTVRGRRWVPEACQFLEPHYSELRERPVAYFVVCLTMRIDTTHNREIVMEYLKPVLTGLPGIRPVSIGLFAGKLDAKRLPDRMQLLFSGMSRLEGDFRNWPEIKNWTTKLGEKLLSVHTGEPATMGNGS